MNELVERLEALTQEQRELIKELESENRRLKTLMQTLGNRIRDLEDNQNVFDAAIADIPIGIVLLPENELNKY